MAGKSPWQTYEEWEAEGLNKGYDKRNPASLEGSKKTEERSWYKRATYMRKEKWKQRFPFTRKLEISPWQTYEEWKQYGIENGFNQRNPASFDKSEESEERAWYKKGLRGGKTNWAQEFPFAKKLEISPWQTYEEWKQYGLEKRYDGRSRGSLRKSGNKDERRWYCRGVNVGSEQGWLKTFPFTKLEKPKGYWKNWSNVERELSTIVNNLGHFPTQEELKNLGRNNLNAAFRHHGGLCAVRQKIGYGEQDHLEEFVRRYTSED